MLTLDFPLWRARIASWRGRLRSLRQHQLHHLEALFGSGIPAGALSQTDQGPNSRRRVYTIGRTFWGFLYQVLHPHCPCRTIVRQVQALCALQGAGCPDENSSAYCQARLRLPLDLLQRLRHAIATRAHRLLPEAQERWYGLCPKVIDGTSLSLPDTPKNQRAYPQCRSQKPGCGFPLMNLVAIFSLSTDVLLDYAKSNKHQNERPLLNRLLDRFQAGDLALADRGFCSYGLIALLLARQVQSLFRLHQSRSADLRQGQRLGKHDRLFTWQRPGHKPRYLPKGLWKRIPARFTVRVLRFQVQIPGFRTESVTLMTTLCDPRAYPAQELARLYGRRWRIELWFRDIKTTMGMEVLRCQSPEMVHRELEMFFIAYNLIRGLTLEAAVIYEVPLERISFKGTIDTTAQFTVAIAQARSKKKQRELIAQLLRIIAADALPNRPGRCEPRVRKRRPKYFPLLNQPRRQLRDMLLRKRSTKNTPRKSRPLS